MHLNNYTVIDRHNRPSATQRVGLRTIFINDGVMQDPVDISAVTVFRKAHNLSPSTVLNSSGLLDIANVSSYVKMNFGVSSHVGKTGAALDASDYTPGTRASGIYRVRTGEYMAVLDGTVALSGNLGMFGIDGALTNATSATDEYIDVWTVKLAQASEYKTFINYFKLFDDTFFTITQPLLLKVTPRLVNRKVVLGSKVDLKITNEISIENKDIDESIINIFKDSVITSAQIEIKKLNEESSLPARLTVSSFTQTLNSIDITSDNTMVFNWDTNLLYTHPNVLDGTFGPLTGTYTLQIKFNLLNETYISPLLYLIVT